MGAYPPPAKNQSSSAAEKSKHAAQVFADLLKEGGHSVETTDKMDEVRYQKVGTFSIPFTELVNADEG